MKEEKKTQRNVRIPPQLSHQTIANILSINQKLIQLLHLQNRPNPAQNLSSAQLLHNQRTRLSLLKSNLRTLSDLYYHSPTSTPATSSPVPQPQSTRADHILACIVESNPPELIPTRKPLSDRDPFYSIPKIAPPPDPNYPIDRVVSKIIRRLEIDPKNLEIDPKKLPVPTTKRSTKNIPSTKTLSTPPKTLSTPIRKQPTDDDLFNELFNGDDADPNININFGGEECQVEEQEEEDKAFDEEFNQNNQPVQENIARQLSTLTNTAPPSNQDILNQLLQPPPPPLISPLPLAQQPNLDFNPMFPQAQIYPSPFMYNPNLLAVYLAQQQMMTQGFPFFDGNFAGGFGLNGGMFGFNGDFTGMGGQHVPPSTGIQQMQPIQPPTTGVTQATTGLGEAEEKDDGINFLFD